MKKLFSLAVLAATIACNSSTTEPAAATAEKTPVAPHNYSVKARYSSAWEIGDPQQAETIITLWKHFDNNTLDSVRSYFADSIYMELPGFSMNLQADSALAGAKADRAQYSSLKTEIDAIMPLKTSDHPDETVVAIWGEEIGMMGGKPIKRKINEIWGFNKSGKVAWMSRYERN